MLLVSGSCCCNIRSSNLTILVGWLMVHWPNLEPPTYWLARVEVSMSEFNNSTLLTIIVIIVISWSILVLIMIHLFFFFLKFTFVIIDILFVYQLKKLDYQKTFLQCNIIRSDLGCLLLLNSSLINCVLSKKTHFSILS